MLFSRKKRNGPAVTPGEGVTLRIDGAPGRGRVVTACHLHIGTRPYQQDAAYVCPTARLEEAPGGRIYGVLCDGMGGMENGGEASEAAVRGFCEAAEGLEPGTFLPSFLAQQAYALDKRVYERYGGEAGTTMVAAVVEENRLFWISAGDSRLYILKQGTISRMTRDHNYDLRLQEAVRENRLTAGEAEADPMREALISYIGMGDISLLDGNNVPFILHNGDVVLLCSDGLVKSLSDQEIAGLVYGHFGEVAETARLLPAAAFDKGGGAKDNTSVIVMQYHE